MGLEVDSRAASGGRTRCVNFLYHELRAAKTDYSYAMETSEFARHLDYFCELRRDEKTLVLPEITFDDGHVSNFEIALPELTRRGLTARFFITAGWTGAKAGYMNWEQLRELAAAGQQVGAHGWSHTLLTHCNAQELVTELQTARVTLEDKLGMAIDTMSLPGGRYNATVLEGCKAAGYAQVFTSIPRFELVPLGAMVGRLNLLSGMSLEWIAQILDPESGKLQRLERQYRIKDAAKRALGDRLYHTIWSWVNHGEKPEAEGGLA